MERTVGRGDDVLTRIVSTVSSTLELDEVLRAVVRLLSEASAVHACFVYLREGDRLTLRAAGAPYDHLIGKIALEHGTGLAWWVVEHNEPAFVPDDLFADPRVVFVPELDEERFQSLLSVPIPARDGTVIGVISAHTEAPRAFTQAEVDFVVTSASLVAGAIENARLYDETRARVRELEAITELAEMIASAHTLAQLVPEVTGRTRALMQATACHLYLLEPGSEELELQASAPLTAEARRTLTLAELGPELARGGRSSRIAVPLVASDELLGLLVVEESGAVELARAVASQIAVGIKKIQLIERLTEQTLIKDFFDDLAAGRRGAIVEGRAAKLGCDLDARTIVLAAEPADQTFARALASLLPGSLVDRRDDALRALLRVPAAGAQAAVSAVRRAHAGCGGQLSVGLSSVCSGLASFGEGFAEAAQALTSTAVLGRTSSVVVYEELGAYKYLLRIAAGGSVRDETIEAVERIAAYDRERGTALLQTLEEFLTRRGSINATAEALYVHANTLRQRLRRIADISGIDLRRDEWLMVEIAVKLVQLDHARSPRS